MPAFNENIVEIAAIDWLKELGYATYTETDLKSGDPPRERENFEQVILLGRLAEALARINPRLPGVALDEAIRKIARSQSSSLIQNNQAFHRLLVEGVDVSYTSAGQVKHEKVWLVDFDQPANNDFLAVNQYTLFDAHVLTRQRTHRRPDVVLFVNGLPLVVIEIKNAADENATIEHAYNQLQTYKDELPTLFTFNEFLVITDGTQARIGTLTSGWEWYKAWRTIDGAGLDDQKHSQLEVLLKGVFAPARFLDLMQFFVTFEMNGAKIIKKMAGYHQYHAVNKAVESTVIATQGDRRVGVIWHTQGSGKSLTMLFYAGKIIQHPAMQNPTLVILTDRNDLDDQLFDIFASSQELLRQQPVQAENRDHIQALLQVASGGVVFTTIQKFRPEGRTSEYPQLSERRNIVFMADEAHRSQYGFEARVVKTKEDEAYIAYGFAKYVRDALPNASFIGFTGTPIESTDVNTPQVFGDYIDVYDIQRAVEDQATVPIYYEARLARLQLKEEMRPLIDPMFEEVTEGKESEEKENYKSKWSRLEAMVGTQERLAQIAADIVQHFEHRLEAMDGKAMIVCMSRRICVDLYNEIIKLRPDWHHPQDDQGAIKVVMTGSASDQNYMQPHIRNKPRRKALADRFKDENDLLKLVIVRDMWLTGFDVPPLHTMYIDKPMQGHGLMQAIARVNRVFKDKPGGLIVDYLGIATDLQEAVAHYTTSGSRRPTNPQMEAVEIMLSRYESVQDIFYGFDFQVFHTGTPTQRLSVIPAAMEHVLSQQDGKKRYMDIVAQLSQAFALAMPHESALEIRDDVAFFQAVRAAFVKTTQTEGKSQAEIDSAIKQLVSQAVASPDVVSIFDAVGLKTPDVSILSDEFLEDMRGLEQRNLAMELLRKLLNDEIKARSRKNTVQARSFEELLDKTIQRYQNRTIDVAEVITELIDIAKEMRDAHERGEQLGLSEYELAFYDALAANENAVEVMGNDSLAAIARELVKEVRKSVSIDWTVKQGARAKIKVLVKRILRRYGYPPNLEERATETVLEQAELLAAEWAMSGAA